MTVSIIIPAYNSEKFIKRCLDSVINQIYKNLEIIVIDDASKDNTKQIIKEYAEKDNRIRPFYSSENKGVSFSRNIGLKASTGEYIMFVDSDDELTKDAVRRMIDIAVKYNSDYVDSYEIVKTYPITKIEKPIPFYEVKGEFTVDLPYELEGWSKGQDLSKMDKEEQALFINLFKKYKDLLKESFMEI